jgi:hypothetical protein
MALLQYVVGAQCTYSFNEFDEFTKAYRVRAETKVSLNSTERVFWRPTRVDDTYYLAVEYANARETYVVGTSDALMLMLDNGEVLKLYPDNIYTSDVRSASQYGVYYTLSVRYDATRADFEKLAIQKVLKYRVYSTDVYREYDVSGKGKPDKLQTVVRCVLQAKP